MQPIAVTDWAALDRDQRRRLLARPVVDRSRLAEQVAAIIEKVRRDGDAALLELSERFDGVRTERLEVAPDELAAADAAVEPGLLAALERAADRIRRFHQASAPRGARLDTEAGLACESRYLPIAPVGLYVPGGSAPLVSTVLMLAIPARLAGCEHIVLCTPPRRDGSVHPALLAAAALCGVRRVFRVGGAQAIAAMAWGTESVPACAKLYGPGNAWVTEAKLQVAATPGGAAQDLPAGPSEVLIIADSGADPVAVAWDLLAQAEHGPDSQSVLLSDSTELLKSVAERLPPLAAGLPRAEILAQSLAHCRLVRVGSVAEALGISNSYAPEHLILNCRQAESLLDGVSAAGSVFVGPWTPESLGDYSSGTNHVLPTYGYARAYGGLSVADFQRRMTVQRADPHGLAVAGADAMALAAAEGLDAHRMAVACRLDNPGERP